MRLTYNRETCWIQIFDLDEAEIDSNRRAIPIPLATWKRIQSAPEVVYGFEAARMGLTYRLTGNAALERIQVEGEVAYLPLDEFQLVPPAAPDGAYLYLGVSGTRDGDASDATRIVASWGYPPSAVRTGWDVSDEVLQRIPNISRSHIWPHWTRIILDTPHETVIVPVGATLGSATGGVVEKLLLVGRRVLTAETPARRVARVGLVGGDLQAIPAAGPA